MNDKDLRQLWKSAQPPRISEDRWKKVWAGILSSMCARSSAFAKRSWMKYAGIAAVFAVGVLVGASASNFKGSDDVPPSGPKLETTSEPNSTSSEGYDLCGLRNVRVETVPGESKGQYKMTALTGNNVKVVWQYNVK